MSFALYTIGTLIMIAGALYVCHLMHVPQHWQIAICLLLLGGGIMGAVTSTRQKDPSS